MTGEQTGSRRRRRLASAVVGLFAALAVAALLFAWMAYEAHLTNHG